MATVLPEYFLPSSAPSYSYLPRADEETIEYNPRPGASPSPQGTVIRKWSHATVILKDQHSNARLATYGRMGVVSGEIEVTHPRKVFEVKLKFEGSMSIASSDSSNFTKILFANSFTLWSKGRDKEERCPSLLPFVLQFPSTYEHEGKAWRLPPSFEATFLGIPALFARCTYTLKVTVIRIRQSRLDLRSLSNSYTLLLNYRPRTRPHWPVFHSLLFSSVKAVPDEWSQIMLTVPVRPNSKLKPIDCQLFVPSILTFCISEPIPFHLQICSTLESLLEFFPRKCALLNPDTAAYEHKHKYSADQLVGSSVIRIYIARQVCVDLDGRRRFRTCTVGTGTLRPVPPSISQFHDIASDEITVDWTGEIRCWPEVTNGGFSVSHLLVKDFLVMTMAPFNGRSSSLLPAQIAQSIKLVTDPWAEDSTVHPNDR